jgi:hypothetical protein
LDSYPPKWSGLEPVDLVDIAEAAMSLGLHALAQEVLNAAYDRGNGKPTKNLFETLVEIHKACKAAGVAHKITKRQFQLINILDLG